MSQSFQPSAVISHIITVRSPGVGQHSVVPEIIVSPLPQNPSGLHVSVLIEIIPLISYLLPVVDCIAAVGIEIPPSVLVKLPASVGIRRRG